jgi:hypothetical protein
MCAAWYFSSGRAKEFDCENCNDDMRRARNCGGEFGHKRFAFQIGKIEDKAHLEDKVVFECPRGLIGEFETLLWRSYQDSRFKKELGIATERIHAFKFEAFKTFEIACNEYNDWKQERENKKIKRRAGRGRRT